MKMSSCHIDRPYHAKDMCKQCYAKNINSKLYLNESYKQKVRARTTEWRRNNTERVLRLDRSKNLQKKYGITLEQYESMLNKQQSKCAICHKEETVVLKKNVSRLAVDHDHKTGKVRGLLCFKCNTSIAFIENNFENLNKVKEYLQGGKL